MVFDLSEELINQIIFAMEDQNADCIFDASTGEIVPNTVEADFNRYYTLPEWNSVNGFRIMERFVSVLRNPLARQELRDVLFCGKGVFRNFKNVLKQYPEIERMWFSFKEKEIKQYILRWYNALCDAWGLEKLGEEPEETDELVYEDFSFRIYDSAKDDESVMFASRIIMNEIEDLWPEGEVGSAIVELWQAQCSMASVNEEFAMLTEAFDGEFAGFISAIPLPKFSKKTVLLTTLFVLPSFRGLGLGKELLARYLDELRKRRVEWVIISNILIPQTFEPCLLRNGFTHKGTGYIADLRKSNE